MDYEEHLRKQAWKDHIDNWRKKNRSSIEDANPEVEKINVSCAKWRRLDVYMEDLKFGIWFKALRPEAQVVVVKLPELQLSKENVPPARKLTISNKVKSTKNKRNSSKKSKKKTKSAAQSKPLIKREAKAKEKQKPKQETKQPDVSRKTSHKTLDKK